MYLNKRPLLFYHYSFKISMLTESRTDWKQPVFYSFCYSTELTVTPQFSLTLKREKLQGKRREPPCSFISPARYVILLICVYFCTHPLILECSQPALCIPEISRKHVYSRNMHHKFSKVIRAWCVKKRKRKALRISEGITLLAMEGKAGKCYFFGLRRRWEEGKVQREPIFFSKEQHYVLRKEIQWCATHLCLPNGTLIKKYG